MNNNLISFWCDLCYNLVYGCMNGRGWRRGPNRWHAGPAVLQTPFQMITFFQTDELLQRRETERETAPDPYIDPNTHSHTAFSTIWNLIRPVWPFCHSIYLCAPCSPQFPWNPFMDEYLFCCSLFNSPNPVSDIVAENWEKGPLSQRPQSPTNFMNCEVLKFYALYHITPFIPNSITAGEI